MLRLYYAAPKPLLERILAEGFEAVNPSSGALTLTLTLPLAPTLTLAPTPTLALALALPRALPLALLLTRYPSSRVRCTPSDAAGTSHGTSHLPRPQRLTLTLTFHPHLTLTLTRYASRAHHFGEGAADPSKGCCLLLALVAVGSTEP